MPDRTLWFGAKLTDREWDKVKEAMRRFRGKTLENITKSDIVRAGIEEFCKAQGIEFREGSDAAAQNIKAA